MTGRRLPMGAGRAAGPTWRILSSDFGSTRLASPRRGFTLVELLVAISVIGILTAILLPAVQQARESARRTQCLNQLKQIALALHSYHDTFHKFPMATHWAPTGTLYSALTAILPYHEQDPLFGKYDSHAPSYSVFNESVVAQAIPVYLCPSMVLRRPVPATACGEPKRAAGSYAVCTGTRSGFGRVHDGAIVPHYAGPTHFASLHDGTSHTLLAGEIDFGLMNYLWASGPCRGEPRYGNSVWGIGHPGMSMATTVGVFNSDRLVNGFDEYETFRSDHIAGAHFAMADGSVRFIHDTVDDRVLDALATRAGHETVVDF